MLKQKLKIMYLGGLLWGGTTLSTAIGAVGGYIVDPSLIEPTGLIVGTCILPTIGAMLISEPVGANPWIVGGSTAASSLIDVQFLTQKNFQRVMSLITLACL